MLAEALQTVAKNLDWIYGGHFVLGLEVGAASLVTPYYLAEVLPTKFRVRTIGAFQAFLVAGSLLAYCITSGCDLHLHPTVAPNIPAGTNTPRRTGPSEQPDPNTWTSHFAFHSAQWRVPMAFRFLPRVIFSVLIVSVKDSPIRLAGRGGKKRRSVCRRGWGT
ncbi:hypothetical protein FS749_001925 [Ceratobasidium sp. UAMH 11750]|nr:hypothetical protein FS749_001925 [Ceratobasidium sp. UAMH 11750]